MRLPGAQLLRALLVLAFIPAFSAQPSPDRGAFVHAVQNPTGLLDYDSILWDRDANGKLRAFIPYDRLAEFNTNEQKRAKQKGARFVGVQTPGRKPLTRPQENSWLTQTKYECW